MSAILARVVTEPIRHDEVVAALAAPEHGAELLFWGVVRASNDGRRVRAVSYDAHVPLAEKTFRDIGEEVRARFGGEVRVVVIHRTGRLEVGEASVVVGVAAPHRDEAYEASRYAIEQLKARSPIWKQEHYEEGDSAWLPGRSLRRGATAE